MCAIRRSRRAAPNRYYLTIWKAGSHEILVDELLGYNVEQLVIPPESGVIAIRSYDTLHTWERSENGEWKPASDTVEAPGDVAYSHDGSLLAMAMDDKTIVLRSRENGKTIHTFNRSGGELAFTPDDKRLISSHGDGTLTVWTVP